MKNSSKKKAALVFALALATGFTFAQGYNPTGPKGIEVQTPLVYSGTSDVAGKTSTKEGNPSFSDEIKSAEEIELPLRRLDYGVFYDDFDRKIPRNLLKEAKKMYVEQEKAKEITALEEIEKPVSRRTTTSGSYNSCKYSRYDDYYDYDYYYDNTLNGEIPEKVVFYDALGRRISDDLAKEASKIYQKQQRQNQWNCNFGDFWYGFWNLIKNVVLIIVVIFGIAALRKKLKG